jgi:Alpha-galactosidase
LVNPELVHISQAGVSLVLGLSRGAVEVIHWGEKIAAGENLEELFRAGIEPSSHAELDAPHVEGLFREAARGVISRPALLGHRAGKDFSQLFQIQSVEATSDSVLFLLRDEVALLEVSLKFSFVGHGVLVASIEVENHGEDFNLEELSVYLPLPDRAKESMDFAGRWVKERQPHRREIQPGIFSREVREGRSSHDYTILQLAMTKGADFGSGEVWSLGLMFSGNSRHTIEKLQGGRQFIGAAELLLPGEMVLKRESATPPQAWQQSTQTPASMG